MLGIVDRQHSLLSAIQRSVLSKNANVLHAASEDENPPGTSDQDTCRNSELALVKAGAHCGESALKQNCSICSPEHRILLEDSCVQSTESSTSGDGDGDGEVDNSMALVAVQKVEDESNSVSVFITEIPERKFGWPLLRRAFLPDRQISVVQWAMQLPSRNCFPGAFSKQSNYNQQEDQSSELDGESGAIVLVGADTVSAPSSPSSSRSVLEELEGLHEKYSSTCRLFEYQELLRATSNFTPGLISIATIEEHVFLF